MTKQVSFFCDIALLWVSTVAIAGIAFAQIKEPAKPGSLLESSGSLLGQESKVPASPATSTVSKDHAKVSQLRIYTINKGKLEEFVKAWREGVYRLRIKHGYQIPSAWTIKETNQFIWILTYQGPKDWEAKEAEYYGSAERARLNPDPAQWIARAERWFIAPVSPEPPAKTDSRQK